MAYIIINGKKSNLIEGLLISTLPPITKPLIRNEVVEIDGKDGDIVNTLGYSAYDKEFEIGLHGNYNVDEVISYFNTSGEIIFSNEIDKIYTFAVYEQIDFEKLIRFKTAKVKMHVQPFKKSAVEPEVVSNTRQTIIRNSGNIYSKPIYEIVGSGNATLQVNDNEIINLDLDIPSITIDVAKMEATYNGILVNRKIEGDYDCLQLPVGRNVIKTSNNISEIRISNYSRWI